MKDVESFVIEKLYLLSDKKYAEFQSKLIPNIEPDKLIGVRTPELRKFAKEFYKMPEHTDFMKQLPHEYFDENNLHAFLICQIKDFDKAIEELELFLPYVDNWATCDQMNPKVLGKNKDELLINIKKWIDSGSTYTVRFGIGMLMSNFLDDDYRHEYAQLVCSVKSDEYYINMMIAWYFATALAKRYDDVISFVEQRKLDKWVHNKTIQKAVESYRISGEQKNYLRKLKIK